MSLVPVIEVAPPATTKTMPMRPRDHKESLSLSRGDQCSGTPQPSLEASLLAQLW